MESQYIGSNSGMEQQKEVKIANQRGGGTRESILRILALVLTLTASIVLGVGKQTEIVSLKLIPTLPPIDVPATAKWHYLSAFVYMEVSSQDKTLQVPPKYGILPGPLSSVLHLYCCDRKIKLKKKFNHLINNLNHFRSQKFNQLASMVLDTSV